MTDKQNELIKKLNNIITELAEEAEKDNNFNSGIAELEIFAMDLLEVSNKLMEI
jgi:hypothetical protein